MRRSADASHGSALRTVVQRAPEAGMAASSPRRGRTGSFVRPPCSPVAGSRSTGTDCTATKVDALDLIVGDKADRASVPATRTDALRARFVGCRDELLWRYREVDQDFVHEAGGDSLAILAIRPR
jgi:hypothetical protein